MSILIRKQLDIVFRKGGKTLMSGLNLTHQVQISEAEVRGDESDVVPQRVYPLR